MWNISPLHSDRDRPKKFYQYETDHKDRKTGICGLLPSAGQDLIQEEQKDEKKKIKELFPELTAAVILTVLSAYLLGGDVWTFWTWWLLALFMGMVAMPVTGRLFGGFEDRGWLFSKVLAIAVTGFLTWLLVAVEILPFTAAVCVGVSVAVGILCAVLFHVQLKQGIECYPSGRSG